MVSEWMEHGNINEFVAKDKHVNRTELVRRPSIPTSMGPYRRFVQLVGVANGLMHMHGLLMVHGDLKGVRIFSNKMSPPSYLTRPKANILINRDRRACLADFGLSTITGVATRATAGASRTSLISNETLMSFTAGGTRRWMSPELLDPEMFGIPQSEGDRPTRQSDCYALGMVIYEVCVRATNSASVNS
jgi:serine/threonine protein kinase